MSDVRLTPLAPHSPAPEPAAARAAQAAFFRAALAASGAAAEPGRAMATPPAGETTGQPSRSMRPGALLDIRV